MSDNTKQEPSPDKRIVLHYLADSRSQRILWLLEELGVPYELKVNKRGPDMLVPPELKAIHPLGAAPVLTDGDLILAESGLIVEYLISRYGSPQFQPPTAPSAPSSPPSQAYIDNLYYTHYAEGSLMPLFVNKLVFSIIPTRVPFFMRPIARLLFGSVTKQMLDPKIEANLKFIDKHLSSSSSPWFTHGPHPIAADFMMSFPLEAIASSTPKGKDIGSGVKKFVNAVHERPAYKRALEKSGPYAYAGRA